MEREEAGNEASGGHDLTDAHVHLDFFADPSTEVAHARAAGVTRFVVPGVRPGALPPLPAELLADSSVGAVDRGAGLHPEYTAEFFAEARGARSDVRLSELRRELRARVDEGAAFLGECGLDRRVEDQVSRELQREVFRVHLELSRELALPLVLHVVRRHDDALELLAGSGARGMVHAFVGAPEVAARYRALGFVIGVGPFLLRAKKGPALIAALPVGSFVLETDAPGIVPTPLSGEAASRRESIPADLAVVAARVAALRGESLAALAEHTTATVARLFGPR